MKTLSAHWVAVLILASLLEGHAQGYIVPNGVDTNTFPGEINVWNPGTQGTSFIFTPIGKHQPTVYTNVFSFSEPVTIGVRVFLVQPNDALSLQPILSQSWAEFNYPSNYTFSSGIPFYVGLYTGRIPAPPYPPTPPYTYLDPVFGWAKLVNNQGVIQLLDYALEYQGGGIYVGTQTIIPIPEPSVLALSVLGSLTFAGRHWRKIKMCLLSGPPRRQ